MRYIYANALEDSITLTDTQATESPSSVAASDNARPSGCALDSLLMAADTTLEYERGADVFKRLAVRNAQKRYLRSLGKTSRTLFLKGIKDARMLPLSIVRRGNAQGMFFVYANDAIEDAICIDAPPIMHVHKTF